MKRATYITHKQNMQDMGYCFGCYFNYSRGATQIEALKDAIANFEERCKELGYNKMSGQKTKQVMPLECKSWGYNH